MTFVKGQSGNPGGRPKRRLSLTDVLRDELAKRDPASDRPNYVVIVEQALLLARRGDLRAIEFVFERIDGKVTQPVDLAVRDLAQRVADGLGLTVADVLAEADSILTEKV